MKWWVYVMCIILILSGATCGALLYDKSQATSGVFGDGFSQDMWADLPLLEYHSTGVKLEEDVEGFSYQIDEKAITFDGTRYDYKLFFNDIDCLDVEYSYGIIDGRFPFRFYGTDGSLTCELVVHLTLNCKANVTTIIVSLSNEDCIEGFIIEEQAEAFGDYLDTYGLHIVLRQV